MRNKIFILVSTLLSFSTTKLLAQNNAEDLQLIKSIQFTASSDFSYYHGEGNDQHAFKTHGKSAIAKYNPVTLTLKGAMLFYQNIISPQLSRECPYEITCSNFCKQSIKEFGIVKGIFIGADRILRCNRISLTDIKPWDIDEKTGKIYDPPTRYR
jgi:putative component of membrane protein insertase Oxa1/YidC/SpoIIIJ protein YidD